MRIKYQDMNLRSSSREIIEQANQIIREYQAQGFDLSLRQLYYQFVRRNWLRNTEQNYKRLGSIVSDGRIAGLIPWNSIEDRTRPLHGNSWWNNPAEMVANCVHSYSIDKWANQDYRIEVWVEKDALQEVVAAAANPLDIRYFPCKGYVSQSAMWRAARRLKNYESTGQTPIVLYLGDHDPSGIDMTRDIQDRLHMFRCIKTEVIRIALTMEQIEDEGPPPNPAKVTDSRFEAYQAEFGDESWELDALEPRYLADLITEHVFGYRNEDKWEEAEEKEAEHKELLRLAAAQLKKKV